MMSFQFRRYGSALTLAAAGVIATPGTAAAAEVVFETRALSGDAAPGTTPGVNFRSFGFPTINGSGQTAFSGVLTGPGLDRFNSLGIWSEAAGEIGSPALIARDGDAAPGTPAGVNFNRFSGFSNIHLNNAGQLAFQAIFTDGSSGVFVATIPKPTSLALLGLGLFAGLRRKGTPRLV